LIFWCEGLEWSIAGQARHLPPVDIPLVAGTKKENQKPGGAVGGGEGVQ